MNSIFILVINIVLIIIYVTKASEALPSTENVAKVLCFCYIKSLKFRDIFVGALKEFKAILIEKVGALLVILRDIFGNIPSYKKVT